MMLAQFLLQGSLIGFLMAIPVGPVGMLCIQNALRRGLLGGFVAGLGAACADAVYGGMAGFGVSLLSHVMISYQIWLQLLGAVILSFIGIKIFVSHPSENQSEKAPYCWSRTFLSTFVLTLTNPVTFLCFAAVYTSFGIAPAENEILPGMMLMLGILFGAALWWMSLSVAVSFVGKKFELSSTPLFNRISGAFLAGCGCLATLSVLADYFALWG